VKKALLSFYLVLIVSIIVAQTVTVIPTNRIEQRNGKQYYVHVVQKGQTVYSIAKAYNVGIDEIYYENPSSKNGINVNQELLIPTQNKETEIRQEIEDTDFEFFYHVCAQGETFADVAGIYLLNEENVRRANPDSREPFREGQYLKIPVEVPESVIKAEFPPEAVATRKQATKDFTRKRANTVSFNPNIAVIPDYRHVVIAGETTKSIADKYKVDIITLKAVNPGLGDRVEKGERLRIPATGVVSTTSTVVPVGVNNARSESVKTGDQPIQEPRADSTKKEVKDNKSGEEDFRVHVVQKKENLYRISRNYGVTIQDLYDANPGLTENINIGQKIRVPKKKITEGYIIYRVKSKTRLRKIAKLYNIPESAILKINRGIEKRVYRGQAVKIPVGRNAIIVDEIPEKTPPKKEIKEKEVVADKDFGPCNKTYFKYNKPIKIALMVPLFLEEISDSTQVEKVLRGDASGFQPFSFISFVEGAQLAVDSLRKTGVNVDLQIYDVDKSLKKTTKVLQNPELKNADLIIGPFYSESFNQVALFAGNFGIPIVNPLTYRQSVLKNYKTVIKVKPEESTQLNLIKNLIAQKYINSKLFLITQNSYRDADKVLEMENELKQIDLPEISYSNMELYNYAVLVAMRDEEWVEGDWMPNYSMEGKMLNPAALNENINDTTYFENSLLRINYMSDGFDRFINNASALRPNTVVIYGRDKAFVMDVMNKLNEFRDSLNINVIGLPLWEKFDNLDMVQLNNLKTITPQSEYIDYNSEEVQDFIYKYRTKYFTDPDEYGFIAYDITMYFANASFYYGRSFEQCLGYFQLPGLTTNMKFEKAYLGNNSVVNTTWNLIQYYKLKMHKLSLEEYFYDNENANY